MKREIIQEFLTVPGIVGVALMDGLSTPYFHGFESSSRDFNPAQQIAVAQNIQQVLETTPEGFNSFEFQFDLYRAYLHKLNQGMTLLVLTDNQLPRLSYTQAIRRLLLELQINQADAIAEFRSLALELAQTKIQPTQIQLSKAQDSPLVSSPVSPSGSPSSSPIGNPPDNPPIKPFSTLAPPQQGSTSAKFEPLSNGSKPSEPAQNPAAPLPQASWPQASWPQASSLPTSSPQIASFKERALQSSQPLVPSNSPEILSDLSTVSKQSVNLKDVLSAINALSQLTTQYLGTLVVANYWKATRPSSELTSKPVSEPLSEWLNHFQIERSAQMTFSVQMPSERLPVLTPEQFQCLQAWVDAFIERCSKVIRGFAKIVQRNLDEQQLTLLFRVT
jgi:hypothetical protein